MTASTSKCFNKVQTITTITTITLYIMENNFASIKYARKSNNNRIREKKLNIHF